MLRVNGVYVDKLSQIEREAQKLEEQCIGEDYVIKEEELCKKGS